MRNMQKELDELKDLRKREARQAEDDREELAIYRDRCLKLEEENEMRQEVQYLSIPRFSFLIVGTDADRSPQHRSTTIRYGEPAP